MENYQADVQRQKRCYRRKEIFSRAPLTDNMEMHFTRGLRKNRIIDRHFTVVAPCRIKVQILQRHLARV